ncbi:Hypothetical protein FKW44_013828 [Caligus rogercresseyi]|uniref:Uncharacterized protein n=1 Tax=Caligus rogercresseyi TaxID=217165 RepID=A0A7T8GY50_CALRO|nr:Hypothetical protein FKW44_013828 [Caligus rogercresseyi]
MAHKLRADQDYGIFGFQPHCQWNLGFVRSQLWHIEVPSPLHNGSPDSSITTLIYCL